MERSLAAQKRAEQASTLITEIILENFMSYEYARIPLRPGLNIICGPNGAGKSSILLAISVALGQAYTERSRKLSDLIRRGKETARVSLMLDNTKRNNRRPIPFSNSDTFMLSRYLKKDGSYWFEADYHEITKSEVQHIFREAGINPDNFLIIMHQGMIEEFIVTTNQEKLKMLEEAVGFSAYRENIIEAQQKLLGLVSEEDSVTHIMENAGQTLDHWKGIYDRYIRKKELLDKKVILERELVWSRVIKNEKTLDTLRDRQKNRRKLLEDTSEKISKVHEGAIEAEKRHLSLQTDTRKLYFSLLRLEKDISKLEASEEASSSQLLVLEKATEKLEALILKIENDSTSQLLARGIREQIEQFRFLITSDKETANDKQRRRKDLSDEVQGLQAELGQIEKKVTETTQQLIDLRVDEAILRFHQKDLEKEVSELNKSISEVEGQLSSDLSEAEKIGTRVETSRTQTDVTEELRLTNATLQAFSDVPEDAEKIYSNYSMTYDELKRKLETISENKESALKEVEQRKKIWLESLRTLLEKVNPVYHDVLSRMGATGMVRLTEENDIETSGLQLLVGFRGGTPVVLDAYAQSGGERSASVIAFLLALQRHVLSPFRAVDEFDVHLDPRNRELLFKTILSYMNEVKDSQYIVITPSQLTVVDQTTHIITVQSTYGKSEPKEVKVSV